MGEWIAQEVSHPLERDGFPLHQGEDQGFPLLPDEVLTLAKQLHPPKEVLNRESDVSFPVKVKPTLFRRRGDSYRQKDQTSLRYSDTSPVAEEGSWSQKKVTVR